MKKIGSQITAVYYYLRYLIVSRHRKGHGVHSPIVYDFVSKVLFDTRKYSEYQFFDSVFASLKVSEEKLPIEDIGEDSMHFNMEYRKVRDLVKISSIPAKFGRLLFRIAKYYQSEAIVELGTSIGISSIYLSKGNPESKVLTIEGNKDLCDFALGLFSGNKIENISVLNSNFDQVINELPADFTSPQLVFIDGNHKYESTLRYLNHFKKNMKNGIIIIDDIYWSAGMHKAWEEIVKENNEYVTIDLYRMGIILIRESVTPGHYVVGF